MPLRGRVDAGIDPYNFHRTPFLIPIHKEKPI